MPLKLSFYGAAGEVTGSRHLLEADGDRVLLDCGLFQGHRHEAIQKNKDLPFDPRQLGHVLLSHAHIDHSGGLPMLAKRGATCPIHCTRPTVDLCSIMLMDSAHLQEEDAKFFNKIHAKNSQRIEALYDERDARQALALFKGHECDQIFDLSGNIKARLLNAGHVLGSAMIQVDAKTGDGDRRILFTGDLGRRRTLLVDPPKIPEKVDYLIIESTYGNRQHEPIESAGERLGQIIHQAIAQKSKVLIPSFALERTQEILFILEKLRREKSLPNIPIFVDSPMATSITEIFNRRLDLLHLAPGDDPFGLKHVRLVATPEESKSLNDLPGPLVILSASGMCEGGRILHHLRNNIEIEGTIIVLVGYQAAGTLGRRLQDGARKVKIFGLEHDVWAKIEAIHSFSAHADKEDLLWFIQGLNPRPRRIFLVHGDSEDRSALAEHLKSSGIDRVACPQYGESFELL